ncbi:MAG: hypothetical protein JWN24_543 [Phycisphaerales bacterium]|nr:hypothetical protein [Phycisphaerales bacterium]
MYYLIKKNQKKLLAVFAVGLMIAFLLPTGMKNGSFGRGRTKQIGQLGKTPVFAEDRDEARSEWKILSQYQTYMPEIYQRGPIPYVYKLGIPLAQEINQHNELFFLLQKEAEQRGIRVSNDEVAQTLKNQFNIAADENSPLAEQLRPALSHFLMVQALRDRLSSDVKISEPIWTHALAEGMQKVRLNLVEFSATDLKATLPPPTTQQVESLYNKFKGDEPEAGMKPADDPLGFGYKVPNRVKLQYVEVPRAQVLAAVRAGKKEYDWDVQARQYYYGHQQEFVRAAPQTKPSTEPATQPTTAPATQAGAPATQAAIPATKPATQAKAEPTTRPFAEVKDEILKNAMKADADKLQKEVTEALQKRLADDYAAYRKANPTTLPATNPAVAGPTTQPTTQPAGYASYGYLEQVAQDIQKQFNVLPEVHQVGEWSDAKALAKQPGIGYARAGEQQFPDYAAKESAPFTFDPARKPGDLLQVLQPSEQLSDYSENAYVFRLTDASPAHSADLAEVRARVESDAQLQAGYAAAQTAARQLADVAGKDGLSKAAVASRRVVISTGPFGFNSPYSFEIPNFEGDPASTRALMARAHDLLSQATPGNPHPVAVVEMPGGRKVLVAELADVTLDIPADELAMVKLQQTAQEQSQITEQLAHGWFNYDAVTKRLNYKPEDAEKTPG